DLVDTGQPLRRRQLADVAIDLGLERLERQKARDVERDHELPDIGVAAARRGEILDVAAERGAIERPCQEADYEGETETLVAAHRQISALGDAARVGDR